MSRVLAILLEGGDRDLLVVRVVLKPAGAERDGGGVGLAVRAGLQIGIGERRGTRKIERHDRLVQVVQQGIGRSARKIETGTLARSPSSAACFRAPRR